MNNRKKKHHYRPTEHLRRFSAPDEMVWVYDRTGIPAFRQNPKNIGYERFLYAPLSGPDPEDDTVENWLEERIDTPSVRPLRLLLDGNDLSNGDKLRFARFLGMQDMRTPRACDYLLRSYQARLDHWYQSWISDLPRLQREIYESQTTTYTIEELREFVAEHHPEADKLAWLEFIQNSVADAAGRIMQMRWEVVDAPAGLEFVTSDLGVVKFFEGFDRPCTWRMGFSLGVSHWFVPLSSHRGVALIPSTDPRPLKATRSFVKAVNRRLVLDAWRFVFSTKYHKFVPKWWAEPDSFTDHFIMPPDIAI